MRTTSIICDRCKQTCDPNNYWRLEGFGNGIQPHLRPTGIDLCAPCWSSLRGFLGPHCFDAPQSNISEDEAR